MSTVGNEIRMEVLLPTYKEWDAVKAAFFSGDCGDAARFCALVLCAELVHKTLDDNDAQDRAAKSLLFARKPLKQIRFIEDARSCPGQSTEER
ncbi:hypothetical protein [Pseudomonas sp. Hp2]|uniref:hypothetical protein n=1 Tax=Pseudomonas sp. Hp2 TaxID=701189 RepID=UPI0011277E6B|nr:hypothetical protein [Pseudomonas sp. Hp2]